MLKIFANIPTFKSHTTLTAENSYKQSPPENVILSPKNGVMPNEIFNDSCTFLFKIHSPGITTPHQMTLK